MSIFPGIPDAKLVGLNDDDDDDTPEEPFDWRAQEVDEYYGLLPVNWEPLEPEPITTGAFYEHL